MMRLRKRRGTRGAKLITPDGLPVTTFPSDWMSTVRLYGLSGTRGTLYRAQPNIRPVVDFIAESAAHVPLKVYRKVPKGPSSLAGRIEEEDHAMAELLDHPSPSTTRFRFWREVVADYIIYDVAFAQKIRIDGTPAALVRIPPSALMPERDPVTQRIIRYTTSLGTKVELADLIIFHGYDPEVSDGEVSILDTLRRILAEEQAAGNNREHMWRNASRKDGVVSRPLEAPAWKREQREAWRTDWEGIMSGDWNSGRIALLEDGMTWTEASWSPREAEYLGARKMTRAQCAAVFRVDPRLVFAGEGNPDREAWTGYYVNRLDPLLTQVSEEVDLQLLPEFEPLEEQKKVFTKFNINVKLRGSFEERLKLYALATGQAWMAPNEARKLEDYPPIPGFDSLTIPLNVLVGGQASPQSPTEVPGDMPAPGQTPGPGTQPRASIEPSVVVSMTPAEAQLIRDLLSGKRKADDAQPIVTTPGTTVNIQVSPAAPIPPPDEIKDEKSPPWHIEKQDDKYCVVVNETGKVVPGGCHDTRAEAQAHMDALYANANEAEADAEKARRAEWSGKFALRIRGYFERTGKHLASTTGAGNLVAEGTWVRWDNELAKDLQDLAPDADADAIRDAAHSINEETRDMLDPPTKKNLRTAFSDDRAATLGDWFGAWLA